MHEMSLCESILQILEEQARAKDFSSVRKVRLEIGRFSSVEPEALRFGFDVVMKGSVADGAELEIIELPGKAFCLDCVEQVEVMGRLDPCPGCGGGRLAHEGGDEMRIKDLEVV